MNFCERLREIRNELKTIDVIQDHILYNLIAYVKSITSELDRLALNAQKFRGAPQVSKSIDPKFLLCPTCHGAGGDWRYKDVANQPCPDCGQKPLAGRSRGVKE